MYMIKKKESKISDLTEHLEKGLRYIGKAMQCLEELGEGEDYPEKEGMNYRYPMEDDVEMRGRDYEDQHERGFRRNRRM